MGAKGGDKESAWGWWNYPRLLAMVATSCDCLGRGGGSQNHPCQLVRGQRTLPCLATSATGHGG